MEDFQMEDFQSDFLAGVAAALGLTYEQMTADYDAMISPEEKAARDWWRRYYELQAWQDAIYRTWFRSTMLSIYLDVPSKTSIWMVLVGYDPQRLLAPPVSAQDDSRPPWSIGRILAACGYREVMQEMATNGEMVVVVDKEGDDARIVNLMNVMFDQPRQEYVLLTQASYDRLMDIRSLLDKPLPPPNRDYLRHDPTKQHGRRRRKR